MGKLVDMKQTVYGDFLKWLDEKKIGDIFSNDVWANRIFDRLFNVYKEERQAISMSNQLINNTTTAELEAIIADRKRAEEEALKNLNEKEKTEHKTDMKLKEKENE